MSAGKVFTYEHARLERVVDGDTIDAVIDVGFRFATRQRLRLLEYDTPERSQPGFQEATDHLIGLLSGGVIQITTVKQDSFGRWLSFVRCAGVNVNEAMRQWLIQADFTEHADD